MKAREFVRKYIVPAGGVFEGTKGDHHIYRLPNGKRVDVPMGGRQSELSDGARAALMRQLKVKP